MTDDQATMIDVAASLPSFGLTRKDFEKERDRLLSVHGVASAGDVCWSILNGLEMHASDDAMRTELRLAKAERLRKEGRDPAGEIRTMFQSRIRQAMELGAANVEILAENCCEECAKLDRKVIPCEKALKNTPVSNPSCTRYLNAGDSFPTCRCMIVAVYAEHE